jgi:signal transduction histidine kinase
VQRASFPSGASAVTIGHMERRTASRLAFLAAGVPTALILANIPLFLGIAGELQGEPPIVADTISSALLPMSFVVAGFLIARRIPRNPVGWLTIGAGFFISLGIFMDTYAVRAILRPGTLPAGGLAAWIETWAFIPLYLMLGLLLIRFPTGAPGPGGRWLAPTLAVTIGLTALFSAFSPQAEHLQQAPNPLALEGSAGDAMQMITAVLGGVIGLLVLACIVALVIRARRAAGDERQQIKTLGFGAFVLLAGVATAIFDLGEGVGWNALMAVPIAIGIAILKYRLYGIDVVINKTIVYGILAGFIGAVYVAVVVGIGQAVGAGDEPNIWLSIAATVIVAVTFHPLRERLQRLANRVVYGKRATPYEVLAEFSERVGGVYATEDVLQRMARIVGEATGSASSEVWLVVGDELRPAAGWPTEVSEGPAVILATGDGEPVIPGADRSFLVVHQGQLLGALSIVKPPREQVTPAEEKLLRDLAGQAGLVLRNVRLTTELRSRLDEISRQAAELRASRQRLVAAQDAERRRLERNLHDGAQQHLVSLMVKLRLAETMAKRDPDRAVGLLSELQGETSEALDSLRDLARGIYPPLLADQGLAAALTAQARKFPMSVTVEARGVERYPQEVEAAVYFCCLEALQNVAKYAAATRTVVEVSGTDRGLEFEVRDDGNGFDPTVTPLGAGLQNMSDRLEALGGSVDVRSAPSAGTTIRGQVPVRSLEAVTR